jgi:fucose 4-O-acetylase-like acetyltransferase
MPKKPTFGDFLLYQALILLLQGALFSFLALNVQRRTDLETPLFDKLAEKTATLHDARDLLVWSVPFAAAALVLPVIATLLRDSVGFIRAADFKKTETWKFSLAYINIAVSNQILFTFLLITVFVWLFTRFHDRLRIEPHWAGIVAATAFAFAYIYLISTAAKESPVTSAVMAGFITVSLVGILGYLYWRKGLEYSLLAGVIGFGLYPFIASLILK